MSNGDDDNEMINNRVVFSVQRMSNESNSIELNRSINNKPKDILYGKSEAKKKI